MVTQTSQTRILIVDDVPEMLNLVALLLDQSGLSLQLHLLPSGVQARFWLMQNQVDWVLLDEVLPGESAYEVLTAALEQRARVLLMTSVEVLPSTLPRGVVGRVRKPGWGGRKRDEEFVESVRRLLALPPSI